MKKYIFKNIKFITVLSIGTLITSLFMLIVPIIMNVMKDFNTNLILFITISMIISLIIQYTVIIVREKMAVKMNIENSIELYDRMLKLKYNEYVKLGPSYLVERISGFVNSIYLFVCTNLTTIITNVIVVVISVSVVSFYNIYLGILLLIVVPFNYFAYKKLNKTLVEKSMCMQKQTSVGFQNILSLVTNPDFIKQYQDYPFAKSYMRTQFSTIYESIKEVNIFAQSISSILKFINIYVQNITILIISYSAFQNQPGISQVVIVSIILPIYFNAVSAITNANLGAHEIKSGISFLNTELNDNVLEKSGVKLLSTVSSIQIIKSYIIQNNIEFQIEGDLYFEKSDIVYVSGVSGSGKSSLLKALASITQSDFIMINHKQSNEFDLSSLKQKIVYVAQDSVILPISLQDNLKIGRISDDVSLKINGIGDYRLSEIMYENGKNLSGGEKQRVALTRALITQPDVLLLDEITSNIDVDSTQIILNEIKSTSKNRITFITSHDSSVKSICNKEIRIKKQRD